MTLSSGILRNERNTNGTKIHIFAIFVLTLTPIVGLAE